MKTLPSMTVVMPSFNQAPFLDGAIQSVISQGYHDLEFIILDGGSTDGSVEIIKRHESKIAYWTSRRDGGVGNALNSGLTMAKGEILCCLNSDDRFAPGALLSVGEYFQKHPECQWLAGTGEFETLDRKPFGTPFVPPSPLTFEALCEPDSRIAQPSVFWRETLWKAAGPFDTNMTPGNDLLIDFDLWLRFSRVAAGHTLNKTLSIATMHPAQKSSVYLVESMVMKNLIMAKHGMFEPALKALSRPIKRAYEADRMFSFITRSWPYRLWRDRKEK